jgi:hypothetical protein
MDNVIGENLEAVLSQMFETARRLSENQRRLNQAVELLEEHREEHPESDVQLFINYNAFANQLTSLKFVTSDFSSAESANLEIHESGSGLDTIEGHVTYTLTLTAGNIVDPEGNSFPIYCEDQKKFATNVLREVGYTTSSCNCSPRQSTYGCPHAFSDNYSGGLGLELTLERFKELGLNGKLMEEVEAHIKTAYGRSDEELYARIGELRDKNFASFNEMLREGDIGSEVFGPGS